MTLSDRFIYIFGRIALVNLVYYDVTLAFSTNSLRRRRYCDPTAHCNKSHDPVDVVGLPEWHWSERRRSDQEASCDVPSVY